METISFIKQTSISVTSRLYIEIGQFEYLLIASPTTSTRIILP